MKTTLIALSALIGLSLAGTASAYGPCGGGTVYYAPAPQGTVAAQPGTGYRTYSYEPATGYRTYSYQPGVMTAPRSYNRTPTAGFHDAGFKVRGNY